MHRLKVICYTPKGKAKDCIKGWALQKTLSFKAPKEAKIISDSEFYYIYDYDTEKQLKKVMYKKVPAAEALIRQTYKSLMNRFRKATDMKEMKEFLSRDMLFRCEILENDNADSRD